LTSSDVCGVADRTLTHTVSLAVVVVDAALKTVVAPVGATGGAGGVSVVPEPEPPDPSGTDDGVSPPVEVDSAVFAAGGAAVVAEASRGCALSTKTATPATAISAAMVTTKNGRDGRAGMMLLVRVRSIRQRHNDVRCAAGFGATMTVEREPSSLVTTSFQDACGLR